MNYTFEYIFIPHVVNNSNNDEMALDNCNMFDTFEFVQLYFSTEYPEDEEHFDWENFSIRKEISKDKTYWFLRFPSPQKEPEAKWGLIIKKEEEPFCYFTFESCQDGRFALCSYKDGVHRLHEFYNEDTTPEEFIQAAFNLNYR